MNGKTPTVNSKMNSLAKKARNKIKFDIMENKIIRKIDSENEKALMAPVVVSNRTKRGPKKKNTRTWFKRNEV